MNRLVLLVFMYIIFYSIDEASAQVPPDPEKIQRLQINITSGRPVAAAIFEIEKRHGVAISYEDLPLAYADDVKDVTLEVRRDLHLYPPGQAPAVIVPKGGTIDFSYDINRETNKPIDLEGMLARLLQASTDAGNAGTFHVVVGRGIMHVFPIDAKNKIGVNEEVMPVLDYEIELSLLDTNGFQALEIFCAAVSNASGQTIGPGTISRNLFGRTTVTLNERRGVAREILVDILAQLPAKLSWRLLFSPGMQTYALNIRVVR